MSEYEFNILAVEKIIKIIIEVGWVNKVKVKVKRV